MRPTNIGSRTLARRLRAAACLATALTASVLTTAVPAYAKMPYDHQKWWLCMVMNVDGDTSKMDEMGKACCEDYSGVWNAKTLECDPPPKSTNSGQLFPGQVKVPSDLRDAPALATEPPRQGPITR
jgi:hypothetical protein